MVIIFEMSSDEFPFAWEYPASAPVDILQPGYYVVEYVFDDLKSI